MDEQRKQAADLKLQINAALQQLKIEEINAQLQSLQQTSQQAHFWDDSSKAQDVMKQIAKLETRATPWLTLQKNITEVDDMLNLNDDTLAGELTQQLQQAEDTFVALKEDLKFLAWICCQA